jgi:hypothetical protein
MRGQASGRGDSPLHLMPDPSPYLTTSRLHPCDEALFFVCRFFELLWRDQGTKMGYAVDGTLVPLYDAKTERDLPSLFFKLEEDYEDHTLHKAASGA